MERVDVHEDHRGDMVVIVARGPESRRAALLGLRGDRSPEFAVPGEVPGVHYDAEAYRLAHELERAS